MKIKLTYFNFPFWRAEASRIALHLADIPFEDIRPTRDEFREMKASGDLPYGQLPILEVEGRIIAQSVAIARFCGKQAGLYPINDDVDGARVDELMDTATQITELLRPSMRVSDAQEKMALRTELVKNDFPKWLGFLDKRLDNNGSDYFVTEKMTIADLVIWRLCGWLVDGVLDGVPTTILDEHTLLKAHYERMDSIPEIRAWMTENYGK